MKELMTSTQKKMAVPLLDLRAQYAAIRNDIHAAVEEVLESQQFILGPEVAALEADIAGYSQCSYGIGVSSGTDALLVSLMAFDVQPGDEIITTPYTFFSTAGVIHRLGARPVFVDIEPDTYNIDPHQVEEAVTSNTKGILPVHLYGQCVDMDAIMEIAQRHHLFVVEDAAQAIGAEYKNRRAGSMGDAGCFSFFPSKNLGGFGEGGMVVTQDETLYETINILRVHGSNPKYYHARVGGNFRLDALQAAVLRVKLNHLDTWTQARQRNAQRYQDLFQQKGLAGDPVVLPTVKQNRHIFNQYIIRVPKRDALLSFLQERQIGVEVYYPVPLHLQSCFSYLGYAEGAFPHSEEAAKTTLALPIYPELSIEQQEYVVEQVAAFYRSS